MIYVQLHPIFILLQLYSFKLAVKLFLKIDLLQGIQC